MGRDTQHLAVVFADVSESSALYRKLGDEAARQVVARCMDAMADVLPRFEGRLVKTLGDAILCVFPNADMAVLAASEMQAVITNAQPGGHPIAVHIGVNYGPVLIEAGDVFGDTVNVAGYLTAVAMPEQILTTDATEHALTAPLKSCVRPVFHTVLKGSGREAVIHQVLWKTDRLDLTDVNVEATRAIPGDTGSLMVTLDDKRVRLDQWRPTLVVGRGRDCDLVVSDRYASRQHLTIRAVRTRFYVLDHSINGTFVSLEGGEEVHVLRGEIALDRSGELRLGRSRSDGPPEVVKFEYDRRSMFRI